MTNMINITTSSDVVVAAAAAAIACTVFASPSQRKTILRIWRPPSPEELGKHVMH